MGPLPTVLFSDLLKLAYVIMELRWSPLRTTRCGLRRWTGGRDTDNWFAQWCSDWHHPVVSVVVSKNFLLFNCGNSGPFLMEASNGGLGGVVKSGLHRSSIMTYASFKRSMRSSVSIIFLDKETGQPVIYIMG